MTGLLRHKNRFSMLSVIAMMLVMTAMLVSCDAEQSDFTVSGDKEVKIELRLSLLVTGADIGTRAITANEEAKIEVAQLKVLVFKANGSAETFCYEAPQVVLQGGKYIVTLRQSQAGEKYRLVIIANAGTKLPFIPENTPKSDALKMITFNSDGSWNTTGSTNFTLFPMWGETAATQAITATAAFGNITMLRALARIDVGCALSGETAAGLANFSMTSVSVYRTRTKGYVAPVNGGTITGNVVTSVSIPPDAGAGSAAYTCTDGKSLVRTIYIAEVPQGTGRDNNICLVIGGTYGGTKNFYRVDLASAGNYIPIKRNCKYLINIKAVTNAGYATEAEALTGNKTLVIATSVSAEAWGGETAAGSGTITLL